MIALEMSLRGLLRNVGLKVGAISRGRFEARIRELATGNPMLVTVTEPMLRARGRQHGVGDIAKPDAFWSAEGRSWVALGVVARLAVGNGLAGLPHAASPPLLSRGTGSGATSF